MSGEKTSRPVDGRAATTRTKQGDNPISVPDCITSRAVCQVEHYKLKSVNVSEVLTFADHALTQANRYKALWLATGDPQAWRLWQAAQQDRADLLAEVGHDGL